MYAKEVYGALFRASWLTIQSFSKDPKYLGAKPGMTSILHTWGQQLWLHPHLHCIVAGGGVTDQGNWKSNKYKDKYLFPKRAMSVVFRAKFMAELRSKITIPQEVGKQAFATKWVVYAKRPFSSPKTVVEYLGRYTHKVAISNHRFTEVSQEKVCFKYKDYRQAGKSKIATMSGVEFLRRFAYHILPSGFVRIRHYGFLASKNKKVALNIAKEAFGEAPWESIKYNWAELAKEKLDYNPLQCPSCSEESLKIIKIMAPERGPPFHRLAHA